MRVRMSLIALATAASGCSTTTAPPPAAASLNAISSAGTPVGTLVLAPSGTGYRLEGLLAGLPSGPHGAHLHATGLCEGPNFTSAGAHLNPEMHEHGELSARGPHLGDLPNITVPDHGPVRVSIDLRGTRAELDRHLFDADGTALVIHASADDYRTDPSGNSGARIACGVLRKN